MLYESNYYNSGYIVLTSAAASQTKIKYFDLHNFKPETSSETSSIEDVIEEEANQMKTSPVSQETKVKSANDGVEDPLQSNLW